MKLFPIALLALTLCTFTFAQNPPTNPDQNSTSSTPLTSNCPAAITAPLLFLGRN